MGKTLFFRSGSDPLILSEDKREMRKQQRIEELRINSGLPPLMRHDSNLPELGRNPATELHKLFMRRSNNQDFFSLNENNKESKKKSSKNEKKILDDLNDFSNSAQDNNDCAICMDISRNSVLRPCNHMITCFNCSILLLNRQDNCPICREKIDDVIKIFMS